VDEYIKNALEAIGAGLATIILVVWRKIILAVLKWLLGFIRWIVEGNPPEEPVGLISLQDYSDLRDQCVVAMDRLDAVRVSMFQFHNGEHFLPGQPGFRCTCTQEIPKPGTASVWDLLEGIQIPKLVEVPLAPLFNRLKKVPGMTKVDCSRICPNKGELDRCKLDLFGVYWLVAKMLPEGFWKTHMVTNHITASLLAPLRNENEELVGFVTADFIDERCAVEDRYPKSSYELCFLARNSWDYLNRMNKPLPGLSRRKSGGWRPVPGTKE
jgi:hypothetical protein